MQLKNRKKAKKKDKNEKNEKTKKKDKNLKHEKSKTKLYEQSKTEENEANEKTGYNSDFQVLTIDPKYFEQSRDKSPPKSNDNENAVNDQEDGDRVYTCESNIKINDDRVDEIEKSGDQIDGNKNNKADKNTSNVENLEFQSVISEW